MSLKKEINNSDLETIKVMIDKDPSLCNTVIKWGPLFKNKSHPLHYLSDRVFANQLDDEKAADIARLLIDRGADINGYGFEELKDTPLVAAASLHADAVAIVLIEAGADIDHAGCYGGTALHWAAWCGRDSLVKRLLEEKIDLDRRCINNQSTAFFWAAHGRVNGGEKNQHDQLACAKMLMDAGSDITIPNINNITAAELLKDDEAFMQIIRDQIP